MPAHKAPRWSARELSILDDIYPREGINGVAEALASRSWQSIYVMASKRGLRSGAVADAPKARLNGQQLEEAIHLREIERWSFARIGATLGVSESAACNAVMAALCVRKGYRPAERDDHGRLTAEGVERLRYALRKGLKGIDIQLRLGLSAGRIAEERRRYNRDLKSRGKAPLPPAGGGELYSGAKLGRKDREAVEALLLQGFGAKRISERTGVSNTSVGRIRNRLIKRLARKSETLPGCNRSGRRVAAAKESLNYIPAAVIEALEARLLVAMPVRRAAIETGIGLSSAYRLRDTLAARLARDGRALPTPVLPGSGRSARRDAWLPREKRVAFYALAAEVGFDEAKAAIRHQITEERRAEAMRPKTFEEQLALVATGVGLVERLALRRPDPAITLGGVATGAL